MELLFKRKEITIELPKSKHQLRFYFLCMASDKVVCHEASRSSDWRARGANREVKKVSGE